MKIVKVLDRKSITGLDKAACRKVAEDGKGKTVPLYAIFGRAVSYKEVVDRQEKISYKLIGEFEARYKNTKVRGVNCFIPCDFPNLVMTKLASLDKGSYVDFAVNVAVKSDETSAVGYIFEVSSALPPSETDMLSEMGETLNKKLLTS